MNPDTIWRAAAHAVISGDVATLNALLGEHDDLLRRGAGRPREGWTPDCSYGDAESITAREHFFDRWDQFAAHLDALRDPRSPRAQFEAAADAVITGDVPVLNGLLRTTPELIRARSPRTHHAALLHYVGANGVEGFRQHTPKNAVRIAQVLLAAGADIDATAEMYGGSDTLGLVATSIHPVTAGVQEQLMDFLLSRGASVATASGGASSSGIVNACLANGRSAAAEFLAGRGAPLDLEASAGIGRLDLVTGFFAPDGSLTGGASERQMKDGFSWACEYGRTDIVEFLLQKGIDAGATLRPHGQTGLHWAAYGGHTAAVRILLQHNAPVDVKDDRFEATPLGWALHAWSSGREHKQDRAYYEIVGNLLRAGARFDDEWLKQDQAPSPLAERLDADPRMRAILDGSR